MTVRGRGGGVAEGKGRGSEWVRVVRGRERMRVVRGRGSGRGEGGGRG